MVHPVYPFPLIPILCLLSTSLSAQSFSIPAYKAQLGEIHYSARVGSTVVTEGDSFWVMVVPERGALQSVQVSVAGSVVHCLCLAYRGCLRRRTYDYGGAGQRRLAVALRYSFQPTTGQYQFKKIASSASRYGLSLIPLRGELLLSDDGHDHRKPGAKPQFRGDLDTSSQLVQRVLHNV